MRRGAQLVIPGLPCGRFEALAARLYGCVAQDDRAQSQRAATIRGLAGDLFGACLQAVIHNHGTATHAHGRAYDMAHRSQCHRIAPA